MAGARGVWQLACEVLIEMLQGNDSGVIIGVLRETKLVELLDRLLTASRNRSDQRLFFSRKALVRQTSRIFGSRSDRRGLTRQPSRASVAAMAPNSYGNVGVDELGDDGVSIGPRR
jgi:hypothetical protein